MNSTKNMSSKRPSVGKSIGAITVLSLAGVGFGLAAGAGYYAKFSSTAYGDASVTAANLSVGKYNETGDNVSYETEVEGLFPGDKAYRFFNITNDGTSTVGQLQLTHQVTGELADMPAPSRSYPSQIPGQNTMVNGNGGKPVQVTLQGCSVPWSMSTGTPTCSGSTFSYYATKGANTLDGTTTMLYSLVSTSGTTLTKVTSGSSYVQPYGSAYADGLKPASTLHFMSTFTMPTDSKNEYQGTKASVTYFVNAKRYPG